MTMDNLAAAIGHYQGGRLAEAERIFGQIVEVEPGCAEAWWFLGTMAQQSRQHQRALKCYSRVVELRPEFAEAHGCLGSAFHELEMLDQAIDSYSRAVTLKPDLEEVHNNLGNALQAQGRREEAIKHYRMALGLRPDEPVTHYNLGNALLGLAMLDEAAESYRRAVELRPNYVEALNNLGHVYHKQGLLNESAACYLRASELRPYDARAHNHLGTALKDLGMLDRAAASYQRAVELKPDFSEAHLHLANVYQQMGMLDYAKAKYRWALTLNPALAEAHRNLGNTLVEQDLLDEAVACFRRALELRPDYADAHNDLGIALYELSRFDEADASYRTALALTPDFAEAHLNRAHLRLLRGDFRNGWLEYEWRWRAGQAGKRAFPQPRWEGQPLNGRTILLYAEQGFGDTIQFVRYAELVQSLGGIVVVECQQPLKRLLASYQGPAELVGSDEALPPFDLQAPLQSLPAILGTTVDTVPADVPYLFAASGLVDKWRERLTEVRGFRIGIQWHGRPGRSVVRHRVIPLERFATLAEIPGVRLIGLQKEDETVRPSGSNDRLPIVRLDGDVDSKHGAFMDTAAILMNLDLVITCDTAMAHVAGALGVPVWLALTVVPDWRWMLDRRDSPWYPTMRLFRQKTRGDWAGVFEEMKRALPGLMESK